MKKLLIFTMLVLCWQAVFAAEVFGTVDALSGSASVAGQDGQSAALAAGMKVYEGDTISSAHDGEVHIVTEDGGFIAIRPDSVFRVDQYKADGGADDKTFMSLLRGAVRSITGWIGKHDNAAYRLSTPTATVGIRGTDHEVTVVDPGASDQPGTYDTVNEGSTVLKTPHGEVVTTPGRFAFAPRDGTAAPYFLAQRPRFLEGRRLKIEGRVLQRREFLRGHFEQMREQRIQYLQQARGERRGEAHRPGQSRSSERAGAMERPAMARRTEAREERGAGIRQGGQASGERRHKRLERGEGAGAGERFGRHRRRERD